MPDHRITKAEREAMSFQASTNARELRLLYELELLLRALEKIQIEAKVAAENRTPTLSVNIFKTIEAIAAEARKGTS